MTHPAKEAAYLILGIVIATTGIIALAFGVVLLLDRLGVIT